MTNAATAGTDDGTTPASRPAQRIVVGVDGSEYADAALAWAAHQAVRTGAALELVTTFGPDYVFITAEEEAGACAEVVEAATRRVEQLEPGCEVTSLIRQGFPDQVLVDASEGAELLVVGSRGLGGFKGLLLGSVSRKCLHRSSVPVVVVHGPDDHRPTTEVTEGTEGQPVHRIVVGVDGSTSSAAALEWAADQAALTGARLEVIMVWDWPTMYGWAPGPLDYDPQEECQKELAHFVQPVTGAHPGLDIQQVAVQGAAAALLVKASSGADLLAVGSRGRREVAGLLLGSVSEHCVIHAHCPVLVHHG